MSNQESAAIFERIIKKLQSMKERNRTNQQREQNKVRAVHSCMNVALQTQIFCNNLTKHRWIALFVDLHVFLQCICFLIVSEKTLSSHFLFQRISREGTSESILLIFFTQAIYTSSP